MTKKTEKEEIFMEANTGTFYSCLTSFIKKKEIPDLALMLLKLAAELRLESPLSLAELVSTGDVCNGESSLGSTCTAESGLSGSGLPRLTLALFLAALFRKVRREFSICKWQTKLANQQNYTTQGFTLRHFFLPPACPEALLPEELARG